MEPSKRKKLKAAGWTVGTFAEFLKLPPDEAEMIELRFSLGAALRAWRTRRKLTQAEVASRLRSSQSRVAKMEAGDVSVSLDLIIRALLQLGATRREIAKAIA